MGRDIKKRDLSAKPSMHISRRTRRILGDEGDFVQLQHTIQADTLRINSKKHAVARC